MAQDIVKDNLSICVEDGLCIHVLSANGENVFSKVRIVQDTTSGDKYLEVLFDSIPTDPLRVLSFGEVETLFDKQIVDTEALEVVAEDVISDSFQLMDIEGVLDSTADFAIRDGFGNVITATYVTKDELGDLSTAIASIIAQTDSIIGGN